MKHLREATHTAWGPQASGKVEKVNHTLRKNIAKLCQKKKSSPLGSSFIYCPAQDKGGPLKWSSIESLWNCVWATISGSDWGGRYVYKSRSKGKKCGQQLSQTLAVINDLTCIRHLSPAGLPHSFEPGGKVLLNAWKTGSPERQPEEKWTGPWDTLVTTPTAVKLAVIKPWIHHTQVKKAPEEQWTSEPQEDLKVIFQKQWRLSHYFLFNPTLWTTYPFQTRWKCLGILCKKCSKHFWLLFCRRNLGWTSFHFMSC